jgi:hypothetical protein
MATEDLFIDLGPEQRLTSLFSYPNDPSSKESLPSTIEHWFGNTLVRDKVHAQARVEGTPASYQLRITGDPAATRPYTEILPKLLNAGDVAHDIVLSLIERGQWKEGWRFFLPLGLPMISQRALQFFHFPPIRLLNRYRDYLNDPVPVRVEELLLANQSWDDLLRYEPMTREQRDHYFTVARYETVIDGAPIAAPDDAGTTIPIAAFEPYQRQMVSLLCHPSAARPTTHTIPIVIYGAPARDTFSKLYNLKITKNVPTEVEIQRGLVTPVLAIDHPYVFYVTVQDAVGDGKLGKKCNLGAAIMSRDLAAARWQILMAEDPSRPSQQVYDEAIAFWSSPAQARQVCTLVQQQGSYETFGAEKLDYRFDTSLANGAAFCASHGESPCET